MAAARGANRPVLWRLACLLVCALPSALLLLSAPPPVAPEDPASEARAPASGLVAPGEPAPVDASGLDWDSAVVRAVASLYYDDAYYYLTIAQRWVAGEPSTFDGRNRTSGYHPLWLALLLPLAFFAPSSGGLLLASYCLQAILLSATGLLVFSAARTVAGPVAAFLGVLVWLRVLVAYFAPWSGMEHALNMFLLALLAWMLLRTSGSELEPRRLMVLALASGLAFLARIDNGALVGLVALFVGLRVGARRSWWFLSPAVVVIGAYLVVNVLAFGHPLPISGTVKASWSAELLAADAVYRDSGFLAAKLTNGWRRAGELSGSALAGLILGSVIALASTAPRRSQLRPLWPLAVFAVLQLVSYGLVYHGGHSLSPWHYAVQPVLAGIMAARWLQIGSQWLAAKWPVAQPRGLGRGIALLLVAAVLTSTVLNVVRYRCHRNSWHREPLVMAATWARETLPADAVLGAWNSGTLAFFSGRRVVNLDGLVNSWSFFHDDRLRLCSYLEEQGVDDLVDAFPPEGLRYHDELAGCHDDWRTYWRGPPYERAGGWRALAFRKW